MVAWELSAGGASRSLGELIEIQPAVAPTNLVAIAATRSIALAGRGRGATGRKRIATITLAEILHTEKRIPLANRSAELDGLNIIAAGRTGESTVIGVIGIAALGSPRVNRS